VKAVLLAAFRLIALLALCFLATKAVFRILPGDPITVMLGESPAPARADQLRMELGLNRPFIQAIASDLELAARGEFGRSFLSGKPVAPVLRERAIRSLALSGLAIFMALLLALPLAAFSANGNQLASRLLETWYRVSAALSPAWLGPVLLLVFAVWVPFFPVSGSVFLPACALAFFVGGFWAKLAESRIRDRLQNGSAPGARARGFPEWRILFRDGVKPSLPALLSAFGAQAGGIVGGAFVMETVFGWPGLGAYLVDAVLSRDLPTVQAAVFASAGLSLLAVALGDLGATLLDPREANR